MPQSVENDIPTNNTDAKVSSTNNTKNDKIWYDKMEKDFKLKISREKIGKSEIIYFGAKETTENCDTVTDCEKKKIKSEPVNTKFDKKEEKEEEEEEEAEEDEDDIDSDDDDCYNSSICYHGDEESDPKLIKSFHLLNSNCQGSSNTTAATTSVSCKRKNDNNNYTTTTTTTTTVTRANRAMFEEFMKSMRNSSENINDNMKDVVLVQSLSSLFKDGLSQTTTTNPQHKKERTLRQRSIRSNPFHDDNIRKYYHLNSTTTKKKNKI
jgi:hypothetical protein